jgi:hypothetical protein
MKQGRSHAHLETGCKIKNGKWKMIAAAVKEFS